MCDQMFSKLKHHGESNDLLLRVKEDINRVQNAIELAERDILQKSQVKAELYIDIGNMSENN